MEKHVRKICELSLNDLKDLFGLFGLGFSLTDHRQESHYKVFAVKSESGDIAECLGWHRWEVDERLSFVLREEELSDASAMEFVAKSISKSLSEKRALAWTTRKTVGFPFGKKTITTRHEVDLPDFSSLSELKLKIAAGGAVN